MIWNHIVWLSLTRRYIQVLGPIAEPEVQSLFLLGHHSFEHSAHLILTAYPIYLLGQVCFIYLFMNYKLFKLTFLLLHHLYV